ncbi:unnamed protein product [Allacma fusca]|uniref:Gustatory receptor n=1 Tax=Allacma fusca TaxID=39272 RepID=A0A8J2LLN9_9HEXA|nr:unnamed protein product [Allacma fusca]
MGTSQKSVKECVVKFLATISGLVPFDPRPTQNRYFNLYTLLFVLTFGVLLAGIVIEILYLTSESFRNGFTGKNSERPLDFGRNFSKSDPHVNQDGPGPSPLVMFVLNSIDIVQLLGNIITKIVVLSNFQKIFEVRQKFKSLNPTRDCTFWTGNELMYFIVVVISFIVLECEAIFVEYADYERVTGRSIALKILIIIFQQVRIFYGTSLQKEVVSLVFICFLCNIAKNMRKLGTGPPIREEMELFKIISRINVTNDARINIVMNQIATIWSKSSNQVLDCVSESQTISKLLKLLFYFERRRPFELSALKFFTISRSSLTAVTSVIVTYQVILLQFQVNKTFKSSN